MTKRSLAPSSGLRVWLLGLGISALAIGFFVTQLNLQLLADALVSGRYLYVVPAFLILLAGLWTRAQRWRALLGIALPGQKAFHILNVSYLVNGVLPLRLGEVARAYLAARANPQLGIPRVLSTVVVERLIDLLAVIGLIALAATSTLPPELRTAALAGAPLALVGLIVLVLLAAQRERALRWLDLLIARVPLLQRLPVRRLTSEVLDGFAALASVRAFLQVVGWTLISWALSVAGGYVLMYAFYPTGHLSATMLTIAAASLAIAVPAVPGNIGTFEASIVLALGAFGLGVPLETATAYAVLVHAVNLLLFALMGGIGLLYEGVSLAQLRQQVQGVKS